MNQFEVTHVNCCDLAGLTGSEIQTSFESDKRISIVVVRYPEQSFRTVLIISPRTRVLRFFKPTLAGPLDAEQFKFKHESGIEIERELMKIGLKKKSLARLSSVIEDTKLENEDWALPVSIRGHEIPDYLIDGFVEYLTEWVAQLSEWMGLDVVVEGLATSGWYYSEIDRFLAGQRTQCFGSVWKLVPGDGWFENLRVRDSILNELTSVKNGDESLRVELRKSPVFTQRDLDRTAIINSVLPSKRLVCQLRPGQTVSDLMTRFDETLLLRAKLISELNVPLSHFFAKEVIDGAKKSISRAPEHESPKANEAIAILQQYRENQESTYPILKRVFG